EAGGRVQVRVAHVGRVVEATTGRGHGREVEHPVHAPQGAQVVQVLGRCTPAGGGGQRSRLLDVLLPRLEERSTLEAAFTADVGENLVVLRSLAAVDLELLATVTGELRDGALRGAAATGTAVSL